MNKKIIEHSFGIGLCICIAGVAQSLAGIIPIGAVTIAIILGIAVSNMRQLPAVMSHGIQFGEKKLLGLAIALMGLKLDFTILQTLGIKSLFVIIGTLCITIVTALLITQLSGFDKKCGLLLGIGNAICGSSAIAATEQIIGKKKETVGLSIVVINTLGALGMIALPLVATDLFHFSDIQSGVLIGNTLQAVAHVVAASISISDNCAQIATLVKMTRVLMLLPLSITLVFIFKNTQPNTNKKTSIPPFIIGFVACTLIASLNLIPTSMLEQIHTFSAYLLITAMAAIGLKISLKEIITNGKQALFVGSAIFGIQLLLSAIIVTLLY